MQELWTTARVEAELTALGKPASRQTILVAIRRQKLPAIAILGRK